MDCVDHLTMCTVSVMYYSSAHHTTRLHAHTLSTHTHSPQGAASLPQTLNPESISQQWRERVDSATQLSQSMAASIQEGVTRVRGAAAEAEQAVRPLTSAVETVSRGVQKLARGEVDRIGVDVVAGAAAIIAVAGLPLVYMATRADDVIPLTKGNSKNLRTGAPPPTPPTPPSPPTPSPSSTASSTAAPPAQPRQQPKPTVRAAATDPRTYNAEDAVLSAESLRVAAETLQASKAAALFRLGAAKLSGMGQPAAANEAVGTSFDSNVVNAVNAVNGLPPRAYPTDETIGTSFEVRLW